MTGLDGERVLKKPTPLLVFRLNKVDGEDIGVG